ATRTPAMVLLGLGLAVGLLVVALGNAGTNTILFQAVEGPNTPRAGQPGLAIAKFEPTKSSGSATHTVITFTFQSTGAFINPTPDPATSSDCAPTPAARPPRPPPLPACERVRGRQGQPGRAREAIRHVPGGDSRPGGERLRVGPVRRGPRRRQGRGPGDPAEPDQAPRDDCRRHDR